MRVALVALLALAGCSSGSRALRHDDRMSAWVEFLPADQIAGDFALAARARVNLNVSLVQGTHDRAYLERVCAAAKAGGLTLRLWPGLPREQGYWPNQANVDAFLAWLEVLYGWAGEVCPRLDGVVVDMEFPIDRVEMLRALRAAGKSNVEVAMWLLGNRDDAAFERARGLYAAAARRARGLGYRFYVTTLPMIADDWRDDDETVARSLWTPIEGVEWDAVSFQVYRPLFDQQFPHASGMPYTSGLVTSYARSIVQRWGARGGVDLGTTGSGIGIAMGFASAADLQADIAAARAEGIAPGRIAIYSLEGLRDKPDAEAWLALPEARAAAIADRDADARGVFQSLDLLGN